MANNAELFSGPRFKNTVQKYCDQIGWHIAEANEKRAILKFNMDSGRVQTLFIIRYESTLEFSVPSMVMFDSEDEIPDRLSTILLKRNAQKKFGFWCIEYIGEKYIYSCMHNAELQLMDTDYFAKVIRFLITECDELEEVLLQTV